MPRISLAYLLSPWFPKNPPTSHALQHPHFQVAVGVKTFIQVHSTWLPTSSWTVVLFWNHPPTYLATQPYIHFFCHSFPSAGVTDPTSCQPDTSLGSRQLSTWNDINHWTYVNLSAETLLWMLQCYWLHLSSTHPHSLTHTHTHVETSRLKTCCWMVIWMSKSSVSEFTRTV